LAGWPNGMRRLVFDLCKGICSYCGYPMDYNDMVLHHVINRKDHGQSDMNNCEPRHKECEAQCHALFRNGNAREGVISHEPANRKRKCRTGDLPRRSKVSRLRKRSGKGKKKNRRQIVLPTEVRQPKVPRVCFRTPRKESPGSED